MLKEMPVDQFVREVASNSPAPGGGSVAALAGAQAAGLLSMYCNLSQDRRKLGDVVDELEQVGREARFLKARLLELIDEDTLAFNRVMEAFRLPKENGEQKKVRSDAIQDSTVNAAEVPLVTARGALRVLSLISEVAARGNSAAITDLGVANLQGFASMVGACYNVKINLGMIKDDENIKAFNKETEQILDEGNRLYQNNKGIIEKEILTFVG